MLDAEEEDSQPHGALIVPSLLISLHNFGSNLLESWMRIEYGHNGREGNDVILFGEKQFESFAFEPRKHDVLQQQPDLDVLIEAQFKYEVMHFTLTHNFVICSIRSNNLGYSDHS